MCSGLLRALETLAQQAGPKRSRPVLDLDSDAGELGRQRDAAAVWSDPSRHDDPSFSRCARADDNRRRLGQEFSRRHDVLRIIGLAAAGGILDQNGTAGVRCGQVWL